MSNTITTVGVYLTEDERRLLTMLANDLEESARSALRCNEGPEAQTYGATREALHKLMHLPATSAAQNYESLGNGDLTPEQIDGMELWDRDVMLDERHRAAGSMLVRRAVAEIRRHRAMVKRLETWAEQLETNRDKPGDVGHFIAAELRNRMKEPNHG